MSESISNLTKLRFNWLSIKYKPSICQLKFQIVIQSLTKSLRNIYFFLLIKIRMSTTISRGIHM